MNVSAVGTLILKLNSAIFHAVKLFETRHRMTMSQATTTTTPHKKSRKKVHHRNTHLTIWHSVCIIFLFHIFSTFFLVSSFHSFSCGVVRCVRDGGKKDENGIDRIPYWTSTWMLNMMISSLSYAYFERRSFLTHVFRCATHILMCRIAQRVVWSVEKLSARHKTQM